MKTQLTKEQSQHLIALGVPKEKASVRHIELTLEEYRVFNLTDLLGILPKEIELDRKPKHFAQLNILFRLGKWWAEYQDITLSVKIKQELIDALYELCVWCLENKYLKFE